MTFKNVNNIVSRQNCTKNRIQLPKIALESELKRLRIDLWEKNQQSSRQAQRRRVLLHCAAFSLGPIELT